MTMRNPITAGVDLLGGAQRSSLLPLYLLGNAKPEEDIAEAQAKMKEGFRFFKLKCGVKKLEVELESAAALRRALGPDVILCADANMGMTMQTARRFVTGVANLDIAFLEQPLRAEDIDGMAELARMSPVPLCADESLGSLADIFAYQRAKALRGVNLKIIKCGGMAETMRAATVSSALGLAVNLACKVAESSIGAAALVHTGYAVDNLDWGISATTVYLAADLVKTPLLPRNGNIDRLIGAGLGVEIDEAAVEHYSIK